MPRLTLPPGQSIRQIAEKLGIPVEQLEKHAQSGDVDRPLRVERPVEVPDGFLRKKKIDPAVDPKSGKWSTRQRGINSTVALGIEVNRHLLSGDLHKKTDDVSREDFNKMVQSFERYNSKSNALAHDILKSLRKTPETELRALVYAYLSQAHSFAVDYFGERKKSRIDEALSCAKAAELAGPNLPMVHQAMAHALRLYGDPASLESAFDAAERAVQLAPKQAAPWICLADVAQAQGDIASAHDALAAAASIEKLNTIAFLLRARIFEQQGEDELAAKTYRQSFDAKPSFINPLCHWAACRARLGDRDALDEAYEFMAEADLSFDHQMFLEGILDPSLELQR